MAPRWGRPWLLAAGVVILACAAALLVPAFFQGSKRERLKGIQCAGRLRSLGQLLMQYASDHGDWLPIADGEHPPACASLQILVDSLPEARERRLPRFGPAARFR